MPLRQIPALCLLLFLPFTASAATALTETSFTTHWVGYACVAIFVIAYALVIAEDKIHLSKSKPVIVAAGLIWMLIALAFMRMGDTHSASVAIRHSLLEFAELMLFLLAAMTYINTMQERGLFDALRGWLVTRGFSLRTIFWVTGVLAFFISPVADNMTTALLLSAVVLAVGGSQIKFVVPACINIVVAANAGGAFSPFGDITTLMVWQKGVVDFTEFFVLFVPSLVNWLVPALCLMWAVPRAKPAPLDEAVVLRKGAFRVMFLFGVTIALAVSAHTLLHLPPVLGMMTGLGLLKLFGYYLQHRERTILGYRDREADAVLEVSEWRDGRKPFDIFRQVERAEWDTLLFFYGIILCVGGLGTLGYLALLSQALYLDLGATPANVLVGVASAVVDNIPVMYAVLTMLPDMSHGQWLLVTLTAGVGGSLLSIGSAAGVAVMGQARGIYTFFAHLKWSWAIALGYAASIVVHFLLNASHF
ncbi:citrate transporter [Salinisphaera sp. PC39]|uniref:sodium:proton antiporter NhaD n=1 Tax=Salinisphaera sp. PC39 TaxID=1304156 RepID=UPI00333E23B2